MGGGIDLGGGFIFSGEIDVGCVGPMFVAMIVFCWFLDLFFSTIEEKVEHSPPNSMMVKKAYKEMMLLGLLMFIFILLKDFKLVLPTKGTTHCFDFSLLMVTFTVFLYVGAMLVSSFGMHVSKRAWDRMAMKTTHEVIRDLNHNLPPDNPTCPQRVGLWADDFVKNTLGIGKHWRAEPDYKVVELLFKTKFYLDRTFDYNKYLELVLEDVVVNLSRLTVYHWFGLMSLCYYAQHLLDDMEVKAEMARRDAEDNEFVAYSLGMHDSGSAADENSGIRRRLGATSAEDIESDCLFVSGKPVYPMKCGMDQAATQNATADMFATVQENDTSWLGDMAGTPGLSFNSTNTTSRYDAYCTKCKQEHERSEQKPLTDEQILVYILGGWLLLLIEVVLLHFLRHRHNLIYFYHGAKYPSNMPLLLTKLEKHFVRNEDRGLKRVDGRLVAEETITVHHAGEDDADSDEDDLTAHIDPATTPESAQHLRRFLEDDGVPEPQIEQNRPRDDGQIEQNRPRDDGQQDQDGEEMEMMHFHHAKKDANDILSYRLYIFLCSITKMVMLVCCLYVAFYWYHYRIRVNQKLMKENNGYGQSGQIELTPWGTDASADRCDLIVQCFYESLFYHFMALLPPVVLVFFVLPRVTRRISLLFGVLHLNDNALQMTVMHMETIERVRTRILQRLETTTVVKGKPNLQKAKDLLARLRAGEVVLLHKLSSIDKEQHAKNIEISHKRTDEHRERWSGIDWSSPPAEAVYAIRTIQRFFIHRRFFKQLHAETMGMGTIGATRLTRKRAMELLDQQETQTETAELVKFLSREAFAQFQEYSPASQETALSAKSLRLSETNPDDDTILVAEFGTFLVRAIADVVNVAGECGMSWDEIKTFEEEVVRFGAVSHSEFVEARRMARSKALFYNISKGSETLNYKQLWKGLKQYRVPISKAELKTVCRIIDPDQTQSITLEEWLDFALASDENLVNQVLRSAAMARKANAEKGGHQGGLIGMALDTVQYSRDAIEAVPLGRLMLTTIEHPVDTGRKAVRGAQELAEMEANDALAVVAGIDKQRRKIVHEFQPRVEGAFVDVASLGLHLVETVESSVATGVRAVESGVVTGVTQASRLASEAMEEVEAGVNVLRGSPDRPHAHSSGVERIQVTDNV